MFGESNVKNRRMNAKEMQDELILAAAFKRRPCRYIFDKPTYDWLPPTPLVNFDLGWNKQGL